MGKVKRVRIQALALVCILLAMSLGGCGKQVEPTACLKARLDNLFQGDTKAVVDLNLTMSESMAADAYDECISAGMNDLFSSFIASNASISDFEATVELRNDFRELFRDIYAMAKYEVGGFAWRPDGSCEVTVVCEQLQIFGPALEEAIGAYEKIYQRWQEDPQSAPQSDAELAEQFLVLLKSSIRNALVNAQYAEPVETTINMAKVADQCYVPQKQDLEDLKLELFDRLDGGKIPHFYATGIYGFDASAYLKGILDNRYKNDSKAFVELMGVSPEQAASVYELGIENELPHSGLGYNGELSESLQNDFRELIKKMFSKARYEVKNARRQEDGSYVVEFEYEQMKIYDPTFVEAWEIYDARQKEWESGSQALQPNSNAEVSRQIMLATRDAMQKVLSKAEYKEPVETTITLVPYGGAYIIREEDSIRLNLLLFDIQDLMERVDSVIKLQQ